MARSLGRLPARDDEGSVTVVVETPRGCASKFKYVERLDAVMLSRPLPAGVVYPHDWASFRQPARRTVIPWTS